MKKTLSMALAQQFMGEAVQVKAGQNIWIEYIGAKALVLAKACGACVRERGGTPFFVDSSAKTLNKKFATLSEDGFALYGAQGLEKMKQMQGYIRITDDGDEAKLALPERQEQLYLKARRPMTDYRVRHTNWLVVSAPTSELAADCGMSYADFERFYSEVCLLDYAQLREAAQPLRTLMSEGRQVRLYSPAQGTDLSFSIEGIDAVVCAGENNIPDGECYTAPVRDSIEGTIRFGASRYLGKAFKEISLRFEKGRVVEAQADTRKATAELCSILDADEGARYVGEFAISFNPYVLHPVGDILFDEKISGALHLALGRCYEDAFNGNKSVHHWDMVHVQRPDYGGGEIWIDGQRIRKDGLFVLPQLLPLNPENLKKAAAFAKPAL